MPRSKGRPGNRMSYAQLCAWADRLARSKIWRERLILLRDTRCKHLRPPDGGVSVRHEQLKDRRDYRQTLIYRAERAHGQRRLDLENKLVVVEREIGRLKG